MRPSRRVPALSSFLMLLAVLDPADAFPQSPSSYLCPRSHGYWKNHASSWPVNLVVVGGLSYSLGEAEDLLSQNSKKDASIILARQLVAAKLNLASGSDPRPIAAAVASADALLGNHPGKIPISVPPWSGEGQGMVELSALLDAYNNGEATPGCATEPIPNLPPSITSIPVETAMEDHLYSYDVEAADPDLGDTVSFSLVLSPAGMSIQGGSGLIQWVPAYAQIGVHGVTVRATDSRGLSEDQSFSISVAARPNAAPVADAGADQALRVTEVCLLDGSGSSDPDGDPLSFWWTLVSVPSGSAAVLSDPSDAAPTFSVDLPGTYVVELTVHDGRDASRPDAATIVTVNSPPAAVDDAVATDEDAPVTVEVLGNDYDVDRDAIFVESVSSGTNGTAALHADGTVSFSPAPDFSGAAGFSYSISDGQVGGIVGLVTVTVAPVNDAPVAGDDVASTPEDTVVVVAVSANDTDVDGDLDPGTVGTTCNGCVAPGHGTVSPAGAGGVAYLPARDFHGTDLFTYEICDRSGACDTAAVRVTVSPVNDAPQVTSTPPTSVSEDRPYAYRVVAWDPDGGSLVYSLPVAPPGMAIESATGMIEWTPTNSDVGGHRVTVRVEDPAGAAAEQTFTLAVENVNDPPLIVSAPVTAASAGSPYLYDVEASDPDVGDVIAYSLTTAPPGMSIDAATGLITWTPQPVLPTPPTPPQYAVAVAATDAGGLSAIQEFTVTVVQPPPANRAPYITSSPVVLATVGQAYRYDVEAADPDPGDVLRYFLEAAPVGMAIELSTGLITWLPATLLPPQMVRVRVTDAGGLSAYQMYSVAVTAPPPPPNSAPTITSTPPTTATVGVPYTYDAEANDPEGDALTFSLATWPMGMSINPATGLVLWTPLSGQDGPRDVNVRVQDAKGAWTSQSFTITVAPAPPPNYPPMVAPIPPQEARTREPFAYDVEATDPEGQALSFALFTEEMPPIDPLDPFPPSVILTPPPQGMAIDAQTGLISWTPTDTQAGYYTLRARATDPQGLSADSSFSLDVTYVNAAPHITSTPVTSATEDVPYLYDVDAADENPADVLAYSLTVAPGGMAIDRATGLITWTPVEGQAGDRAVTVRVVDPAGAAATQSFTVTAAAVNDPPAIVSAPVVAAETSERTAFPYAYDVEATDADAGDVLAFSLAVAPTGMTIDAATGLISWTPVMAQVGEHRVEVRATDSGGLVAVQEFTVTVTRHNFAPAIVSMPITVAGAGSEYRYQVVADDENGDPLAFALAAGPEGMSASEDGLLLWEPAAAQAGMHQVTVRVEDGAGAADSQTFTVEVFAAGTANAAPSAYAGEDFSVAEGAADALDGSHSHDADGDHLRFTWSQTGGPPVTLDNVHAARPEFTAPAVEENTVLVFALEVSDGRAASPPDEVRVMVLDMEEEPSAIVTNSNASGTGSLRAAVDYANAHPGTRITFNIPETDPGYGAETPGVWTLPMPTGEMHVTANGTFLDGASQSANRGDSNPFGPEIEIHSRGPVSNYPFRIQADRVVVRGFVLKSEPCSGGLPLTIYHRAEDVLIVGNYINTDATGSRAWADGMYVCDEPTFPGGIYATHINWRDPYTYRIRNVRIGGSRPGEGNLIAHGQGKGISLFHNPDYRNSTPPIPPAQGFTIQGNIIGLDRTGTRQLSAALGGTGIELTNVNDVVIGGLAPGSGNVIAGVRHGITSSGYQYVAAPGFPEHHDLVVRGNFIGTYAGGVPDPTRRLIEDSGIFVSMRGRNDDYERRGRYFIGGEMPGAGNVISGCQYGTYLQDQYYGDSVAHFEVKGNRIGTDATGTFAPGTQGSGIRLEGTVPVDDGGTVIIGGSTPGAANVIGGNAVGLDIWRARMGSGGIKGNFIGVGPDGVTPVPNDRGAYFRWSTDTVLGGDGPGEGNTVAFNNEIGVQWTMGGLRLHGNMVAGNGGLGIARGDSPTAGPRPNDLNDADLLLDPYWYQNSPVLGAVETADGATTIRGTIDTIRPEECRIDLFANVEQDPSGYGEGERRVASAFPGADGAFETTVPEDLSGSWVTALAVRVTRAADSPAFSSSEFSRAVLVGESVPRNLPPMITSQPGNSVRAGDPYSYQVAAHDPEGGMLAYSLALAPPGMTIGASGLVTWTPTAQQERTHAVTILARDPRGLYARQSFLLRVLPLVDTEPPAIGISLPADLTVKGRYDLVGTVCDPYLVSYAVEVAPQGTETWIPMAEGTACVQNGVVAVLDGTRLFNGLYDLRVTALDESGHQALYRHPYPFEVTGELKIGPFVLTFGDITVPVAGIPITVQRVYNSFDKREGDFGFGWRTSLGAGVAIQTTRTLGVDWAAVESGELLGTPTYELRTGRTAKVLVTYADGRQDRFEFTPHLVSNLDQRWATPAFTPLAGTLAGLEVVGAPSLYVLDGMLLDSDEGGAAAFAPDLFRLTSSDGTILILSVAAGLRSMTDRNGNTVTFGPDGIAHSMGKSISMERDSQGRIASITDPLGNAQTYAYDASGDLVSHTNREGGVTQFRYDTRHNLVSIVDPAGSEMLTVRYDEAGRFIAALNAAGHEAGFFHDLDTAVERVTDPDGRVTTYAYDAEGNVVRIVRNGAETTEMEYDERGNMTRLVAPDLSVTTWTYDEKDRKTSETDAAGTASWTYNQYGDVTSEEDRLGNRTLREYDARGNLLQVTTPDGCVTSRTYDAAGRTLSYTDCVGAVSRHEYDDAEEQERSFDALGRETTQHYDAGGRLTGMGRTRTTDSGAVSMSETITYNPAGRPLVQLMASGKQTVFAYDPLGRVSELRDSTGASTRYEHDAAGRLARILNPDGTSTSYQYSPGGLLTSSEDEAGRVTRFEYESDGRLVRTILADGTTTVSVHDWRGLQISSTDGNGNTTTHEYDALGRRVLTRLPDGRETSYAYDANGALLSMTEPGNRTTRYEYDVMGRRLRTVFPDGTESRAAYDANGRMVAATDALGHTTAFAYDAAGNLISVTDPAGATTRYAYDEVGNRVSVTDALGRVTRFSHDNGGRITRRTLPLGMSETFEYDTEGRLVRKTDFEGASIEYTYDSSSRVTSKRYPDGSVVTYEHDAGGALTAVHGPLGTSRYEYDLLDRLVRESMPDGNWIAYSYDASGNRTGVGTPGGDTAYGFDALNRLVRVTAAGGGVTARAYDAAGALQSVWHPNGLRTVYARDIMGRPTSLSVLDAQDTVIHGIAYTMDAAGRKTRAVDTWGREDRYAYDAAGRLVLEETEDPTLGSFSVAYRYDAAGNRIEKSVGSDVTAYAYDDNDRLVRETSPSATTDYAYDLRGNLVERSSGTEVLSMAYTPENRLSEFSDAGGTVRYVYDHKGARVAEIRDGVETRFVVDKQTAEHRVIDELDAGNAPLARNEYGYGLLSRSGADGERHYHHDGQSRIGFLSGQGGTVSDAYRYSAFGELQSVSGSSDNPYLFTEGRYEPRTGQYAYRLRHLDPRTGRFTGMDPVDASPYDPATWNRYIYAANDPISNLDPTGGFTLVLLAVEMGGLNALSSTSIFNAGVSVLHQMDLEVVEVFSPDDQVHQGSQVNVEMREAKRILYEQAGITLVEKSSRSVAVGERSESPAEGAYYEAGTEKLKYFQGSSGYTTLGSCEETSKYLTKLYYVPKVRNISADERNRTGGISHKRHNTAAVGLEHRGRKGLRTVHELLHTLGLEHTGTLENAMYESTQKGTEDLKPWQRTRVLCFGHDEFYGPRLWGRFTCPE